MPDHPIIKLVLSLIGNDDSKVLHLTLGSRKVKPGEKIPKGGELAGNPLLDPCVVMCLSFADPIFVRSSGAPHTYLECALGTEVDCRQSRRRCTLSFICALESRPALATGRLRS